jgi:hypothetical protein
MTTGCHHTNPKRKRGKSQVLAYAFFAFLARRIAFSSIKESFGFEDSNALTAAWAKTFLSQDRAVDCRCRHVAPLTVE